MTLEALTNSLDSSLFKPMEETTIGKARLVHADAFEWMASQPPQSVHSIVTDPPYGVLEYDAEHLEKRAAGVGGIWRIPPSFDGANRQPLPRFTALNEKDRARVSMFFKQFGKQCSRILCPGGHVILASNSFLSSLVFSALVEGGLEFRGQVIRLVQTFRGGDRPKGAEKEFPNVCSLPRGGFEPWGLFRRPMGKITVAECLRTYGTGGLRRLPDGGQFIDVIADGRTAGREKELAGHPSQKPLGLMQRLVHASLPLGRGVVLDPFMGSGTTIAASEVAGYRSIGIERDEHFYSMAVNAVPQMVKDVKATKHIKAKRRRKKNSTSDQILPGLLD